MDETRKNGSHMAEWVTLSKMGCTCKNVSQWKNKSLAKITNSSKNWSHLLKCHTCKNGSHLQKLACTCKNWVTAGKMDHTCENDSTKVRYCRISKYQQNIKISNFWYHDILIWYYHDINLILSHHCWYIFGLPSHRDIW